MTAPAGRPAAVSERGSLAGVRVPDSAAAQAAEALCREACDWTLYAHSARSYLFAALLGREGRERFDEEALYVASILHDVGLAPAYDDPVRSFEHVSADVAVSLDATAHWVPARRDNVHRAIVMHMAAEVAGSESAEVRLLEAGVACDVTGHRLERLGDAAWREILRALPRGRFKPTFAGLMRREAERKPGSAAAALLGKGLIERIHGAPFADSEPPDGAPG